MDFGWSDWIPHANTGWPSGVEPDEPVMLQMNYDPDDIVGPVPASGVGWSGEADAVTAYCRRTYKDETTTVAVKEEVV